MPELPISNASTDSAPDSFLNKATRGYRSTLVAQAIRLCCKAASVVLIARLVSPADHGSFAMAASVFYALVLFRDIGLGTAAAQAPTLSSLQLNTLFWGHLALGVLLFVAGLGAAPFAAKFYDAAAVAPLLMTMSVAFLLIGAGGFPRAQLARMSRFGEVNRLENISGIAGTAAMIVTGALGGGAFTFVCFLLVSEATATALAWRALDWRPTTRPAWTSLRGLLRTGADVTIYQWLTFALQQIDTIVVGRWFGTQALGFYNRANQLLTLPHLHVAAPLGQVSLVTLSRLTTGSVHFQPHAWKTLTVIAHLILPLFAVCIVLPEETIRLILGAQWPNAAPLLRALAIGASTAALTSFAYAVNVALGRTRRLLIPAAATLPITVLAISFARPHGTLGISIAIAAVHVTTAVPRLWWVLRDLPGGLAAYGKALVGPLGAMLAFMLGLWAGRELAGDMHWFVRLLSALLGGTLALAAVVASWRRLAGEARSVLEYLPLPAGWRRHD